MTFNEDAMRNACAVIDGYLADRAAHWLAEQVDLTDPLRPEPHIGRADAAAWLDGLFASVDDVELGDVRLTVDAGRVAAEWVLTGRDAPTGASVRIPMAGVYDVEEQQIVRARLYYDPSALPRQRIETGDNYQ